MKLKSLGKIEIGLAELHYSPGTGQAHLRVKDYSRGAQVVLGLDRNTAPYLFEQLVTYLTKEEASVKRLREGLTLR
jgi:hypothetical protein